MNKFLKKVLGGNKKLGDKVAEMKEAAAAQKAEQAEQAEQVTSSARATAEETARRGGFGDMPDTANEAVAAAQEAATPVVEEVAAEAAPVVEAVAAAVEEAAPPEPPAPEIYVVQPGDSLSAIAQQLYGDASAYMRIFEANRDKISDPNLIHPGQELVIPR